jgi:UDPglucose--hexose-1-phosphate uridylyltransferase
MERTTSVDTAVDTSRLAVHIERLIAFAKRNGLIEELDRDAARNALLSLFGLTEPSDEGYDEALFETIPDRPVPLLEPLLDAASSLGLLPDDTLTFRDLFDARIMGLLLPRPSETYRQFRRIADEHGLKQATDWFYKLNVDSNYIRMDRIEKNGYWKHPTPDGELEITVNLSKPEKDPREIALLKTLPPSKYPKCLLCKDNVGYAGRPDHPARQNLRILPMTLQGEMWYFQYSPYVYYNEHSIVLCGEHVPMKISPATFARLLDFVDQFPHYFIGSNADLPIVGGSILNHDHFQAGRHVFPMETAPIRSLSPSADEAEVSVGIVQWPLSVIRLRSASRDRLHRVAEAVLERWKTYSDPEAEVYAFSGETPHNTITPIARRKEGGDYELDLVLRNNRTSEEHPDGIFHPHQNLHHIKKENIGLIEVMGLAVLPGRLEQEIGMIASLLTGQTAYEATTVASAGHPLQKHAEWIGELIERYGTNRSADDAQRLLEAAVGDKFYLVLKDAGVFKDDADGFAAFRRFLKETAII